MEVLRQSMPRLRLAARSWVAPFALALTLLTSAPPIPAQAETYNPFIEFACYPKTDAFTIRQMVHHGQKSNMPDDFEEKHGFVNYEDAEGSCTLGGDTIKWTYRYWEHDPLSQCGLVFWGGSISVTVNNQPVLDDIGFGGLLGFCPGSALQYIEISHDRDGALQLRMEGYWGADPDKQEAIRPELPLTARALSQHFPNCNVIRGLPHQKPSCQKLQRFYITKAYKKNWYVIDYFTSISRLGQ